MTTISFATADDAQRLCDIYRLAFTPTDVYQSLWSAVPDSGITPFFLPRLQHFLANPRCAVLKATNTSGDIVGFGYWDLPRPVAGWEGEELEAPARVFPKEGRLDIAEDFFNQLAGYMSHLKGRRALQLQILAVDPSYQRTGAATALLNWGFDLADKEGVELHLEATREGLPLYDRWGFTRIAEPIRAIDGSFEVYPMVRTPS